MYVIEYHTKTNKKVPLYVDIKKDVDINRISLLGGDINEHCGKCKNNGVKMSCPPYSPDFLEFSKKYKKVTLVYWFMLIDDIRKISRNPLIIMNTYSNFQKKFRKFYRNYGEFTLMPGSCEICHSCKLKKNLPCPGAGRIVYSPESVSIDVIKTTQDILKVKTMWWKRKYEQPLYYYMMGMIFGDIDLKKMDKESSDKFGKIKKPGKVLNNIFSKSKKIKGYEYGL